MEEENEVLDWGNEEDEHHQENDQFQEDADDAVSLGDEDDEQAFYAQQFAENANGDLPRAKGGDGDDLDRPGSREMSVDQLSQSQQQDPQTSSLTQSHISNQKGSPKRSQTRIQPRLTHALPPKPVASTMPYIPPSHTSIVEATAMSARTREHKRSTSEKGSHYKEPLPPDWEVRYSRSGSRNLYYYNVVTHQSTWYHPASPTASRGKVASNPGKLPPSSGSYGPSALTYEDRHYRPGSPDARPDDGLNDGTDSRPAERGSTPPKSPRPRGRARSASPAPVIQSQPSTELRDRNQSNHSRRSADAKEDLSDVTRDRNVPGVDSSASRRVASSKTYNNTSGHTNRENRHVNSSVGVAEHAESTIEDGPMLSRSYSSRGRNCERESAPSSVDSRQEPNQSQSLPASRHRSPPPSYHDREWIPAQREQRGPDSVQQPSAFSTKVESILRVGHTSVPRRDKPSRFDQPLATSAQPAHPPIVIGPAIATERPPRPRDRDVYPPDDASESYTRSAERHTERDTYPPVGNARAVYTDDRSTQIYADYRSDRQRTPPVDSEYVPLASDQPGSSSRRKRAPLPPQAASFREEAFRKRDHESPRPTGTRPPHPHNSLPFPSGPKEPQRPSVSESSIPPHGSRLSVPPVRADSDFVHRQRRSVSGHQYTDNLGRERTLSTEHSGSGSVYSQTQAHTPTELPMDVDVDNLPSRVALAPPLDINNDAVNRPSGRSMSAAESAPPPPTSNFAAHPGNDFKRREAIRAPAEQQSPLGRQDFIPRNQRVIYDGTDRHVPRREIRNHPSDFNRPGSSGFGPRLTGPNSVPIGNRRPTAPSQDTGSRLPEAGPPPHESPVRNLKPLPPLPPGKESYERPVYDVKAAVDSYRVAQQENGGSNQHDHSPSSYKRDHPLESLPTSLGIANSKEGRRDFHHRERSRFDQPRESGVRVPQSYERPPLEPQPRPPPPHEAISAKDYQPPKAVELCESPQSPHAKLLAAKEKLERLFVTEERLRKQEQQRQPVDSSNPPKPVPTGLPPTGIPPQGSQDKGFADDRLRNTRYQEQQGQRPDDYRPHRPPSPHLLPRKPSLDRENAHQSASQRRPGLSDPQPGHPRPMGERSHELVERPHRHEGRFDIPKKHGPSGPPPQHVAPVDRDPPHGQRRPERPRPADALAVNVPPSAERRTRWGNSVHGAATGEAAERPDGRGGRSGQKDRYEAEANDGFSGGPHRQHRLPAQPRRPKDDIHLGEPDRARDIPPMLPLAREYENSVPNSRRLLDRLSLDPNAPLPSNDQSLWDRVQIPEKRDRHEMDYIMDSSYEADIMGPGGGEPAMKRARRRNSKLKRPRRELF
ncbi:hypothetical protein APHAL10511_002492 [Amanita phalloides]|nr:hypothetical protein APHAL10511_002492 [Amanita phalloides]